MKDVQLGSGGPPGTGMAGWRAVTRVLRSTAAMAGGTAADLLNAFFPSDCRLCGAPSTSLGDVRICELCLARVSAQAASSSAALCARCGDALPPESARFAAAHGITECAPCRLAPPEFARAVAYSVYDHELRELLHLLKFEGHRPLAERLLGQGLASAIQQLLPQTATELTVIPVPLFAARERARGFNQATLLSQAAIKRLRKIAAQQTFTLNTTALVRTRDTKSMFQLAPHQRRANLRGAFRVRNADSIRGKEILLIDDIMTTGATARECSRILLRAGAAKVWVATVARAQTEAGASRLEPIDIARWTPQPKTIHPNPHQQASF